MSQKSIFEKTYQLVVLYGHEKLSFMINEMCNSYCDKNKNNSFENNLAISIKNDLIDVITEANYYYEESEIRDKTSSDYEIFNHRKLSKDALTQDLSIVDNDSTIFYNKSVVITGTFFIYPNREELAQKLKKLGADINTTITSKTNIVCVGNGAGPSKMIKINELKEKGVDINIIDEKTLYELLNNKK